MIIKATNYDILLHITSMLTVFIICDARIFLPAQEIMTPQKEINRMFDEKSVSEGNIDANSNMLNYEQQREEMIETENLLQTGGHLKLTDKELQVHDIFMRHKLLELAHGMKNQQEHAPALHFFNGKPLIDQSQVFKFLQAMPKGASLHVHRTPSVSVDWMVGNLSYMPGLLRCYTPQGDMVLSFRIDPKEHGCRSKYFSIEEERKRISSISRYDKFLETKFTLNTRFPRFEFSDKIWERFENIFATFTDTMIYEPAFRAFNWQLMTEMYEDNIMYGEVRMKFKPLYGPNDTTVTTERGAIQLFIEIIDDFKRSHPGFLGLKIIYAAGRDSKVDKIKAKIEKFKSLHAHFPNFIIGFDLIGQEDKGKDLHTFLPALQNLPRTAKYFFHAGETNWFGTSADLNLFDAILLNTTRIGHGYALMKHPLLTKILKERDIALEISPISNQVLDLVWDLRNHPGGYFMANDVPLVITNDDPGFWKAKGLSYDLYYAIMSFAPNNAGLKTLKSLVWNSIKYSAMNMTEKAVAYKQLESNWNVFLDRVLSGEVV